MCFRSVRLLGPNQPERRTQAAKARAGVHAQPSPEKNKNLEVEEIPNIWQVALTDMERPLTRASSCNARGEQWSGVGGTLQRAMGLNMRSERMRVFSRLVASGIHLVLRSRGPVTFVSGFASLHEQ